MSFDKKPAIRKEFQQSGRESAQKQLIIFTGESFIAHQHLRDLLPFLAEQNIRPVIFLTPSCPSPRANIPSLQKYFFYEEGIFNDVIYPALEAQKGPRTGRITRTFNELARDYGFPYKNISNTKDPEVLQTLADPSTIGAISIYQDMIFKPDFVSAVKEKGAFFWNLHPAILPQDRGMHVIFWSQLQKKNRHGYSLHEIDEGIDTGRIISTYEDTLSHDKSVVEASFDFVKGGSELIREALAEYLRRGAVTYKDIPETEPAYFSFPTEEDISDAWSKDVRLWGTPEEMLKVYTDMFGKNRALSAKIAEAIAEVENPNQKAIERLRQTVAEIMRNARHSPACTMK